MRDELDQNPQPATLSFDAPVLLVGGASLDAEIFALAGAHAEAVVAADGGANRFLPGEALETEASRLTAVIGDMDSVSDLAHWRGRAGVEIHHLAEQDSTDLEKVLTRVDAPMLLGLGFLGARFDHTLAATHSLLRFSYRRVILIGEQDLIFLSPRRWRARLPVGARVSVFPLRPGGAVASRGLRWPLDGLRFETGLRIGTSNEAAAPEIAVEFEGRDAAVIWDRAHLGAAIEALAEADLSEAAP